MTEELNQLIESLRGYKMSEAEREAQARSFAYGNAKIDNDLVTWEMIDDALARLKAESR